MEPKEPAPSASASRSRYWGPFLIGLLLFVLGPVGYAVQVRMKNLATPWYVPILATAGAALLALSVWRRRGVFRIAVLGLCVLMCGFEWLTLAVAMKTPAYAGPAQPGRKLPRFTGTLASGQPFTERDLETGTPTVLLFFRGRW